MSERISKEISQAIKNLRLPLAFLIVCGHADVLHFPIECNTGEWAIYGDSFIKYPITYISRVIFSPSVPLFFAISGYLFFVTGSLTKEQYKLKLKKRFYTLLIPYLVWNLLYLLLPIGTMLILGREHSVIDLLQSIWSSPGVTIPADPPLWFVRDLIVCVVFSPVLFWIIKSKVTGTIIYLCIISLWLIEPNWLNLPPGISYISLVFFAAGGYIGVYQIDLEGIINKFWRAFISIFFILSLFNLFTTNYVPDSNRVVVDNIPILNKIGYTIGCIAYLSISMRSNSYLSKYDMVGSFVVFAAHWEILGITSKVVAHFCPSEISQFTAFCIYIIYIGVSFIGALLLNKIISRSQLFTKLLTGGRG